MSGRAWFWLGSVIVIGAASAVGAWWVQRERGTWTSNLPPAQLPPRPPQEPYRRATSLPATEPSGALVSRAKQAIQQLDDPSFGVRQTASLRLNSLDGTCLGVIEQAISDPNISPERRLRLETALHFLRPRARFQQEQQLRTAWVDKVMHEGYANGENANPRWDAAAHQAIDLCIRLGFDPLHGNRELRERAMDALADAIDAGCGDPFIRCLQGMCIGRIAAGAGSYSLGRGITVDVLAVEKAEYPPFLKLFASIGHLYVNDRADPNECQVPGRFLRELAKDPSLPPGELAWVAEQYCRALTPNAWGAGALKSFLREFQTYASRLDSRVVAAIALNNLGDASRRNPNEATEDFAEAGRLGEEAWNLDHNDARAARAMMFVRRNQGGNWSEIETWFERAIDANPDLTITYTNKLDFLWERHGSDAGGAADSEQNAEVASQMLSFGHECLETQNWRGGVPLILVEAHRRLADDSPDRREYLSKPEVWADVQAVYRGALLNFPDDVRRRSEYAKLAAQCGRWDIAHEQFKLLGDKPDLGVFVSRASYDYLRRKAQRMADKAETPSGAATGASADQ